MIPKIIHYTGPTNIGDWYPIWHSCLESWFKNFPKDEYKHIYWNDEDLNNLIKSDYPEYLDFYNNLPYHIMKIDFAEYCIMHKYGGIYHDLDMYCYKNFYDMIKDHDCVLLESISPMEFVQNCMMASQPNNDYWIDLMDNIVKDFYPNPMGSDDKESLDMNHYILDTVCCFIMSRVALRYKNPILILPKNIFNSHPLTYKEDYITKHMLTGCWGKDIIQNLKKDFDSDNPKDYQERCNEAYYDLRKINVKNYDFYKDYTGDSV